MQIANGICIARYTHIRQGRQRTFKFETCILICVLLPDNQFQYKVFLSPKAYTKKINLLDLLSNTRIFPACLHCHKYPTFMPKCVENTSTNNVVQTERSVGGFIFLQLVVLLQPQFIDHQTPLLGNKSIHLFFTCLTPRF